jgi:rhamnogalacturonan endolyase
MAICGSRQESVTVLLNDKEIGNTGRLPNMGVMHRDGIRGLEVEKDISFNAALLKPGTNTIKLRLDNVKAWPNGVLYDYLRLELKE